MNILKDIMTFAWRGSGKYVLITFVVLSVIVDLGLMSPVPMLGTVLQILMSGIFCAIYFHMIQSTATGGVEAPEFPDMSNIFEDVIWPMFQIYVVVIVSLSPYIGYVVWAGNEETNPIIANGLLGLGLMYFPMAMLAVVILGRTGALSPHIVIPAIIRSGWLYWLGVILLGALYFMVIFIEDHFSKKIIIGPLIMAVLGSYAMMTNARILGVVYREKQEELGWI